MKSTAKLHFLRFTADIDIKATIGNEDGGDSRWAKDGTRFDGLVEDKASAD